MTITADWECEENPMIFFLNLQTDQALARPIREKEAFFP